MNIPREKLIERLKLVEEKPVYEESMKADEISVFTENETWEDLDKLIEGSVANLKSPKIGDNLVVSIKEGKSLHQRVPQVADLRIENIHLDALDILANICLTDYLFLFASMLQENPIIFVSEDRRMLSSAIQFFTGIIRPLCWPFPVIYSLPENCLQIICSPVPFISGIFCSQEKVLNEIVPEYSSISNPDVIFYFIDSRRVLVSKATVAKTRLPRLRKEFKELHEPMRNFFHPGHSFSVSYNSKSYDFTKKSGKMPKSSSTSSLNLKRIDNHDNQDVQNYIKGMGQIIESSFSADQGSSLEEAEKVIRERLGPKDAKFLDVFLRTQTYSYFHQHYRPTVKLV